VSNEQATFALLQSNMRSWFGYIVLQNMIYFQSINWHLLGPRYIHALGPNYETLKEAEPMRGRLTDFMPRSPFYYWDFQLTRICQEFYATLVSLDTWSSSVIEQMRDNTLNTISYSNFKCLTFAAV